MTTQLLPAKRLLNTIAGYAEVYPVRHEGGFLLSRCVTPGYYDLWRHDPARCDWHLVGGIMPNTVLHTFEVWGQGDYRYDEDGNLLMAEPVFAEDFGDAYAYLWDKRHTF